MYGKSTDRKDVWRFAPLIKEAAGIKLQWDMKWRVKSPKMRLSASWSKTKQRFCFWTHKSHYTPFTILKKLSCQVLQTHSTLDWEAARKNLSSNTYLRDFIWLPYDPKKLCYSNLNWLTPLHTKAMRCYRPLDHGSGWRSWPVWAGCADQHFAGRTLPFHVGSKQLKQNHNEFALGHCNCFSGSSASDFA